MKVLEVVRKTLKSLTPQELRMVKGSLQCWEARDHAHQNLKTLQLFEILLKEPQLTEKELKDKIYLQKISKSTLRNLVDRLQDKIEEAFTLDVNLNRKKLAHPQGRALFYVKKKILASHFMRGKGMYHQANELYDKIVQKAKRYELYDELVETLRLKKSMTAFLREKQAHYIQLSQKIASYEKYRLIRNKLLDWYDSYFYTDTKVPGYLPGLAQTIKELEHEARGLHSDNIQYYLSLMKIEYYQALKQYHNAYKIALSLLKLVRKPTVFINRRVGQAYIILCDLELFTYRFNDVERTALAAQSYLPVNSVNYSLALEAKFYAYFYSGSLGKAERVIHTLLDNEQLTITPYLQSQRKYFLACIRVLQMEYEQAHLLIQQTKAIDRLPEWNTGVRLLTIIIHLEGREYDLAENQIDNLYSYHYRTKNQLRKRYQVIVKLLMSLVKCSFDYKKMLKKHQLDIELLASESTDYRWEMKSPEMILFHEWFKAKAVNAVYPLSLQPSSSLAKKAADTLQQLPAI